MDPRDVIITHMHGDTMINVLALILAILCCDDVRRCASTSPQRSHKDILNPCVHPSSYGEGFCVILNPCVHPSSYGEGFCVKHVRVWPKQNMHLHYTWRCIWLCQKCKNEICFALFHVHWTWRGLAIQIIELRMRQVHGLGCMWMTQRSHVFSSLSIVLIIDMSRFHRSRELWKNGDQKSENHVMQRV